MQGESVLCSVGEDRRVACDVGQRECPAGRDGPASGKRAPRVGISLTLFEIRADSMIQRERRIGTSPAM